MRYPSATSCAYASTTTPRETPSSAASAREDGSRTPPASRPEPTASRSCASSCARSGAPPSRASASSSSGAEVVLFTAIEVVLAIGPLATYGRTRVQPQATPHAPGAVAGPPPRPLRACRAAAAALAACGAMAAVGSSFAVLDGLRGYPAAGGQALRYAAGAALLAALARGRIGRPSPRELVRLALLAATGLVAFNVLVLAAEGSMDPGSVGVIVATVPVLLALAGPLQAGQRPQARLVAAGAIVAAGAATVQGLGGAITPGASRPRSARSPARPRSRCSPRRCSPRSARSACPPGRRCSRCRCSR